MLQWLIHMLIFSKIKEADVELGTKRVNSTSWLRSQSCAKYLAKLHLPFPLHPHTPLRYINIMIEMSFRPDDGV